MPKTNDASGATYEGHEGVVEHAGGYASTRRPDGLSELDPSRNLDGTVVEGFESDEREIEDRDAGVAEVGPVLPVERVIPDEDDAKREETKDEDLPPKEENKEGFQSSRGNSSETPSRSNVKSEPKSSKNR